MRDLTLHHLLGFLMLMTIYSCFNSNEKDTIAELYSTSDTILVVAHRGSHSFHPENSLSAFEASIENGIDIIETDLRLTRDSVFVLIHDETLNRTTNGKGAVNEYSLGEIENFNLLFQRKLTTEKIPTLEQVLKLSKDRIILNLDLKIQDFNVIKKLADMIEKYHMEDSVIISIRNIQLIPKIHKYNPAIKLMPVVSTKKKIRKVMKYNYIDIIQVRPKPYTSSLRKGFQEQGIKIWVNALNKYDRLQEKDKTGFRQLIKRKKVDIIQTDHPEELLEFLKIENLHS
ncbi:glycerophosphodiester phosphodiesterase [Christiangramia sabulilitoris]|uniref:Glycerophosphodiester phosphodiesterase family protein n=1 Tax=Christiangramia sabulilitoris TaxID=2583991 RepID=A0A550I5Z1_9FLAO|nr:glycerophosphodiester phosphodiesterase family protein [Christiangramia sabulilitoris]TRO66371.1 glycerophosphodiester phosphodiesterase family protein [Christiangramia sabulilitoris]